jgi:hypothetical protein
MIWVYGICDHPEIPPPRRRGLAQAPLDGLREGALVAIFTRHAHSVGDPAPDALWAHERVVERLMVDRTVLPMRFGSTVEDEDALRRVLIERRQPLVAALARIAGRVELGVRVIELHADGNGVPATVAAVTAGAPSGREYLVAKLRHGERANRLATELHEPLAALSTEVRVQAARGAEDVLRGAYLVERGVMPRFRATVERLQHAHPEVAILCTGPWPPYTFVRDA